MEKFIISGGKILDGKLEIQSAKNAVLPLLAGSILTDEKVVIKKCPKISDVINMKEILDAIGCKTYFEDDNLIIDSSVANNYEIPQDLAKAIRSSIFLLGSIVSRFKKAKICYPGGCDIGLRPIDLHLKGLRKLGVHINDDGGIIECSGENIVGTEIHLDCASVGATENIMLCAVKAEGMTTIINPAKEPEIVDLQDFLNKMGAKISGAGTGMITINGVKKLHGIEYTPIPDRIEAGTYLIATAMTGGSLELNNCKNEHISSLIHKLRETACKITYKNDKIYIKAIGRPQAVQLVETNPYPAFPTDLQAQFLSLSTICDGTSIMIENMFETRFKHVSELVKMGANITVRDRMAIVRGVEKLHGADIMAYDLRGGVALCLAGLVAEGKTIVSDVKHIDRGYFAFEEKMKSIGAEICRINN